MANMFVMILSSLGCLMVIVMCVMVALGNRQILFLKDLPVPEKASLPFLSIIVAARNEERSIEHAMKSLLALSYPKYEVIVVNDRSEDRTGEILSQIQVQNPELHVVTLASLPAGWLGKNNALHQGAMKAQGEYILFTDADIIFEPESLRKAMGYVVENQLDHLAVIPELVMKSKLLPMMMSYFTFCFASHFQPWKMKDPNSSKAIGIGAFNLVRKRKYIEFGGHEKIKLRPDDDLMLGKLFKLNRTKQGILFGLENVKVEWYQTFSELFHGLEKNVYSGANYHFILMVAMNVGVLFLHILPFAYVVLGSNLVLRLAAGFIVLALIVGNLDNVRFHKFPWWTAVLFPISAILMLVIMDHAVFKTILQRGIYWRGTFYSLKELKQNKLP